MSGAGGQDISWPQCGTGVPIPSDTFTVVGINGGEPFTMNPCFADQYRAMLNGHAAAPSLYINLQYGATKSGYSNCSDADARCQSYDYGYLAAQYAYTQANYRTGGASLRAATWWLDVETANDWNDDQGLNAQVVRGALAYLKTTNHRIGVYSTPRQWSEIVGGYNPGPERQASTTSRCATSRCGRGRRSGCSSTSTTTGTWTRTTAASSTTEGDGGREAESNRPPSFLV
jgi:hypothetical protein